MTDRIETCEWDLDHHTIEHYGHGADGGIEWSVTGSHSDQGVARLMADAAANVARLNDGETITDRPGRTMTAEPAANGDVAVTITHPDWAVVVFHPDRHLAEAAALIAERSILARESTATAGASS